MIVVLGPKHGTLQSPGFIHYISPHFCRYAEPTFHWIAYADIAGRGWIPSSNPLKVKGVCSVFIDLYPCGVKEHNLDSLVWAVGRALYKSCWTSSCIVGIVHRLERHAALHHPRCNVCCRQHERFFSLPTITQTLFGSKHNFYVIARQNIIYQHYCFSQKLCILRGKYRITSRSVLEEDQAQHVF